jgi:predicted nucleic acid-binding protein
VPRDSLYLALALALALASGASFIASSDHDLLMLGPWRYIAILSPATYLLG